MRIYRYEIALSDEPTTLELDAGANVLHVDVKPGSRASISLWATEHGGPRQKRRFVVKGTGHEFDGTALGFVGTVLMGDFVWHVFEELDGDDGRSADERLSDLRYGVGEVANRLENASPPGGSIWKDCADRLRQLLRE